MEERPQMSERGPKRSTMAAPFSRIAMWADADFHRVFAERVGEAHPYSVTADTGMDDLAQRLVLELQFGGAHVGLVGELRGGARAPGHNPMVIAGSECRRQSREKEGTLFSWKPLSYPVFV